MSKTEEPLQLEHHLHLRSSMSSVQSSSLAEIWKNSPSGRKLSNLRKFLACRFGPGQMCSSEFVMFDFCGEEGDRPDLDTFAGKRAQQAFNKIYNDWSWYALTKNKMAFEIVMRGAELPSPETVAIFDRKGRGAGAPVMSTRDELKAFLCDPANHPVFCKPTTGLMSIGSFRLDGMDGDNLIINGEFRYTPDEVVDYITGLSKKGYLFQTVLHPHKAFKKLDCDVISSLRFVVLNDESAANLHSAVLKLPAPGEVADNFWRQGSIIANIDLDAGVVERAVLKTPDATTLVTEEIGTASKILGFQLPDYAEAKALVLQAARHLAGVRVQSWDVALTDKGPVLIEVNFGGDMNLYQLASGMGVMNRQYCDILRKSGFSGRLPN